MASITKRGKYWRAQVRRRGYPTQFRTFDTKALAEAWARQLESEMDRGVFKSREEAERTTFAEALERYWNEVASKKRFPKLERYRINRWLRHSLSSYFLANLRGADFARFRDERRAAGKAENTIRLDLALVSHLFEVARKEWGMEGLANPLKNIRKPSGSKERDRRLRADEYERIAEELAFSGNPWIRPMFDMAIETSLRQGMLCKLQWAWVDLPARVIRIPIEYRMTGNKVVPPALPLSTKAVGVLEALPRTDDPRIFPTSQNALILVWKRTLRNLEISDLRWHDLRHEAASRLFERGLNVMEVASITGHKSLNMLRRYTHLNPEDLALRLG